MKNNDTIKMVEFDVSNQLLHAIESVGDNEISRNILKHVKSNGEKIIINHQQFKKLVNLSHLLNLLVIQGNDFIIESFNY